jgi:opacity protein-like surface antigen
MTTIRLVGCAGLLALTWHTAAPAQSAYPQDWYVGFSGNSPHVAVDWGSGSRPDEGGHGLSLRGGVRLNRRFGVEIAVQNARDLTWTEDAELFVDRTTSFKAKSLEVSAMGTAPFCRIYEGIARGGLAYYDLSGQRVRTALGGAPRSESVSDRGLGYLVSFGIAANPKPKWRFRLEYQFFEFDEDFVFEGSAESAFVESITFGVDYRLGRSER